MNKQEKIAYIIKKYDNLSSDEVSSIVLPITREEMAGLFTELELNVGAEIGVEQGLYSESLCKANPELKLFCIDAWKVHKGYRDHTRQGKLDRYYEATKELLSKYNCEIIRGFSMDVVKNFKDDTLDFVFIDGNHDFQNVTNDIAEWGKKVKAGGIISGHDYVKYRSSIDCHVKQVVDNWTQIYKTKPWFVTTEDFPSFFWIK